jgi:hypothetical protein
MLRDFCVGICGCNDTERRNIELRKCRQSGGLGGGKVVRCCRIGLRAISGLGLIAGSGWNSTGPDRFGRRSAALPRSVSGARYTSELTCPDAAGRPEALKTPMDLGRDIRGKGTSFQNLRFATRPSCAANQGLCSPSACLAIRSQIDHTKLLERLSRFLFN